MAKRTPKYQTNIQHAQGPVIGEHNTVNQHFYAGIPALSTDYASRIQNFLSEYLGTPEQPAPFRGRDADLARLDAWLDDPKAPPYAFLAAPARRGKPALLVQWSQRLLNQIFLQPYIRFEEEVLSRLCGMYRLSHISCYPF